MGFYNVLGGTKDTNRLLIAQKKKDNMELKMLVLLVITFK